MILLHFGNRLENERYLLETVASVEDDRRKKSKEEQLWIKQQLQREREKEREKERKRERERDGQVDNMKINLCYCSHEWTSKLSMSTNHQRF